MNERYEAFYHQAVNVISNQDSTIKKQSELIDFQKYSVRELQTTSTKLNDENIILKNKLNLSEEERKKIKRQNTWLKIGGVVGIGILGFSLR